MNGSGGIKKSVIFRGHDDVDANFSKGASMVRVLTIAVLLAVAPAAWAEDAPPLFGSDTSEPTRVVIDPATGLPMTVATLPLPSSPLGD